MIERTEKLAKFCAETTFSQLDFQVVERTKLIISDTIGAILGGIVEPEVREFLKFRAGQKSKHRKVKIIGLNKWAEQSDASLIHGIAGTTLEMDEGNQFAKGHPAIHVLPALVSVVQSRLLPQNISGQEFLNAFAIGYDVGGTNRTCFSAESSYAPTRDVGCHRCRKRYWSPFEIWPP